MKADIRLLFVSLVGFTLMCFTSGCQSLPSEPVAAYYPGHIQGALINRAEGHVSVFEKYKPVLVYKYSVGTSTFVGSGTLVKKDATEVLVTVAHLFRENSTNSYIFEPLPYGSRDRGIVSASNLKNSPLTREDRMYWDVTIAEVGNHAESITGFYPLAQGEGQYVPSGFMKTRMSFTSLVDGKVYEGAGSKFLLPGTSAANFMYLIPYSARHGESGTGYVDEYGQLYVLSLTGKITKEDALILGVPHDQQFTFLYGPVKGI